MAADNNKWLSFSLMSSMEMMSPCPQQTTVAAAAADSHNFYSFADNFYAANAWATTQKAEEAMYGETEHHHQLKEHDDSSSVFTGYMQPPPKLEDFFAGGGGDSTETQDSSLTHIYDHHHHHQTAAAAYFGGENHHQDLKNFSGFQAFSANSGSEVDDSAFQTQSPVESASELVAYSNFNSAHNNSALSLGVHSSTTNENNNNNNHNNNNNSKNSTAIVTVVDSASSKKIADTFGQRTSIYRGVTRHRWTGRYEAHLWDNSCRREGQARKGRQVYLGGYDKEDKAARAYDLAALKYWGPTATTNFPITNYTKELEDMKHATKQEFIASLRRKSSGFSRGASIYRGVTRHHQQGRWQARIGRVAGNKDLYLGTFATEEEAAEAYDIAAIKFRGLNAVTNFEMNRYDVEAIAKSPLPIGGTAKRLKLSLEAAAEEKLPPPSFGGTTGGSSSNISFSAAGPTIPYGVPYDTSAAGPFYHHSLFQHLNPSGVSDGTHLNQTNLMMTSSQQPEYFIWPHHQSYN